MYGSYCIIQSGMVAYDCNPSSHAAMRQRQEDQKFRAGLDYRKSCLKKALNTSLIKNMFFSAPQVKKQNQNKNNNNKPTVENKNKTKTLPQWEVS